MKWNIKPYSGIGELKFGDTMAQIKNSLADYENEEFRRDPRSIMPSYIYEELGFFIYFDEVGKCEAIEFYEQANPLFKDKNLLQLSFKELVSLLSETDSELEIDESGFISYKLGIGAYAPDHKEEPELSAESIIIFKENYYS
jgi:hypothetical protein